MRRFSSQHSLLAFAYVVACAGASLTQAQAHAKPAPPEGVHELCTISFDKNSVRPARVQNNALPCLRQAAGFLGKHPERKLVLVGVKRPGTDHEPAYVDSVREEEDAAGFAVRLEDLAAYRAVNTKWYLVHYLHVRPERVIPTTNEDYFDQTVTLYEVPGSADFKNNFLNATQINETPCTVQPCYSSDEETLRAQVRTRIAPGEPESTAESRAERRAIAAQSRHSLSAKRMDGDQEALAPLPPRPTPDKPATTSLIP